MGLKSCHFFLDIQEPEVNNICSAFQQESKGLESYHWTFSAEGTFGEFCQFEKNISTISRMPFLKQNPIKLEECELELQKRKKKCVDEQNHDWLELQLQK